MATSSIRSESPLVVIVGPTASGKTALAIKLAAQCGGEIICADSRTVYKGMNIGTAKPTDEERADTPHWGLDIVEPGQRFTAADFKQYTLAKIAEIRERRHIPFIVGGTGLYVDGVLFDYEFGDDFDKIQREQLEDLTTEGLRNYCNKNNITFPKNEHNRRHLIRAIEQKSINTKRRREPIKNTIVVGIATSREILRTRMQARTEQMLTNGVVDEAIMLGKKYNWESEAMTGNIYPLVKLYLDGRLSIEELKEKNTTLDWKLSKRQLTWFRRNPYIYWGDTEQIYRYLMAVLEHKV